MNTVKTWKEQNLLQDQNTLVCDTKKAWDHTNNVKQIRESYWSTHTTAVENSDWKRKEEVYETIFDELEKHNIVIIDDHISQPVLAIPVLWYDPQLQGSDMIITTSDIFDNTVENIVE